MILPKLETDAYHMPLAGARQAVAGRVDELIKADTAISLNAQPPSAQPAYMKDNTFSQCFSCQSCTSVCPVVGNSEYPEETLDLLPHQIMCCLGLGLTEMAANAKMIWDCLTCYQCQENCPQQVEVCDLLYELKNAAVEEMV